MAQLLFPQMCCYNRNAPEGRLTPFTSCTESVRRKVLQFRGLCYHLVVTISCQDEIQVYGPAIRLQQYTHSFIRQGQR